VDLARVAVSTARSMVDQHLPALGVPTPKGYADDLAAVDTMLDRAGRLAPDRAKLAAAVAAALEDDRDPAEDPDVWAALAREQFASLNLSYAVEQHADERRAAAIAKHGPAIIDALAGVVDAADEVLQDAHRRIGRGLDLGTVAYVSQLPPDLMGLWGQARDAVARVERVGQVWTTVVRAGGLAPLEPRSPYLPLVVADLTATQLAALPDRTVTAPCHAGARLKLAGVDEFRQRVQQVQAQRARAARPGTDEPDKRTKRTKAGATATS
jgi:hypothetical protein